jgi:HK97 family phage major capsid protein
MDKRAMQDAYDKMQIILAAAKGENRGLNAKEKADFDRYEAEFNLAQRNTDDGHIETRGVAWSTTEERAFDRYMRFGEKSPELRTTYGSAQGEAGFQASGTSGGYLVPQGFWDRLQIALKEYGGFGQYYQQVPTPTGQQMDWPTVNPTGITGGIIGEGVQDGFTVYTFGQGVLNAWTYTNQVILVSVELATDSAVDIGSFVADRIGEAIGRAEGQHSVNGTGNSEPEGLLTALGAKGLVGSGSGGYIQLGTATSTNVVGGGTVTELTGNVLSAASLAAMKAGINSAYWPNAAWYFSPVQLVNQQNLADSYGRPLYPTLLDPNPTLMGHPVRTVAEIPALTASTTGGQVFGDLERAMIRRSVDQAHLMVLHERYADARQIGYYGYVRVDHRSNDVRAAVTVAASSS